jgi:hypothetical protein
MQYWNEELWTVTIELDTSTVSPEGIVYNYIVKNDSGDCIMIVEAIKNYC